MILEVYPSSIEFVYDQLETNAISFIGGNINYLTISTSVYLEDDEELDSVFFEIDDQINSMYKYPEKVIFYNDKIEITFSDLFIDKYKYINIYVEVTKKLQISFIIIFFYRNIFLIIVILNLKILPKNNSSSIKPFSATSKSAGHSDDHLQENTLDDNRVSVFERND